jgi:hypothetical protein
VVPKHAVRLSVTLRNITNHNNPLQLHNNSNDSLYGTFFATMGDTSYLISISSSRPRMV